MSDCDEYLNGLAGSIGDLESTPSLFWPHFWSTRSIRPSRRHSKSFLKNPTSKLWSTLSWKNPIQHWLVCFSGRPPFFISLAAFEEHELFEEPDEELHLAVKLSSIEPRLVGPLEDEHIFLLGLFSCSKSSSYSSCWSICLSKQLSIALLAVEIKFCWIRSSLILIKTCQRRGGWVESWHRIRSGSLLWLVHFIGLLQLFQSGQRVVLLVLIDRISGVFGCNESSFSVTDSNKLSATLSVLVVNSIDCFVIDCWAMRTWSCWQRSCWTTWRSWLTMIPNFVDSLCLFVGTCPLRRRRHMRPALPDYIEKGCCNDRPDRTLPLQAIGF